jgi:pyruvate dehydrogenase E2 component (dihydrolipoamide acetyltransferase)
MPVSVTMPRLGESVTEGTVTRWLKQEGDHVEADEPLLEVSTDKVDTEIPSPASGTLSRIVVREDETVEVGSELAVIAGEGESSGTEGSESGGTQAGGSEAPPPTEAEVAGAAEAEAPAEAPAEAEDAPIDESPPMTAAPAQAPSGSSGPDAGTGSAGSSGSATPVKMPALGESVTEGTVTRWLKRVGEAVAADEPLVEVSTDKVDTEIPSPVAGILLEIKAAEDEVVAVGADLALIGAEGTAPPAAASSAAPAPPAEAPRASTPPAPPSAPTQEPPSAPEPARSPQPAAAEQDNGYITPLVRKLAAQHGVDLATIEGSGVGGRIRKQDVLEAAERAKAPAAAPAPTEAPAPAAPERREASPLRGRTEKLSRLRAVIAKRMVESLQTAAQLTTVVEVDVTRIAKLRDQAKAEFQARHGVKLSFLPFFALATVEGLRVHPTLNASLDAEEGTVTYHDAEHLGIAVDTERGLVVPVIRDAGDLNLAGLAKRIADLAERTRTNKISPDDLQGGTFTLTNTGSRGALFDTPIINQPQVGILGTGSVVKRAVVVEDAAGGGEGIAPRSMVYLSLTYDHRLVDGADAARFLGTLKERLEAGAFETELGL